MKEINSNIENLSKIQKTHTEIKKNKDRQHQKAGFEKILSDKINTSSKTKNGLKSTSSLPELETFTTAFNKKHPERNYFPDRIENILDMLDTYSLWLGDKNKTLKDISPILEGLNEKIKDLDKKISQDQNPDSQLKHIIKQLMTTINLEQIKMTRGDYTES